MSDVDRDGKLSQDEFFVALHLTRFCKQGKQPCTLNSFYSSDLEAYHLSECASGFLPVHKCKAQGLAS